MKPTNLRLQLLFDLHLAVPEEMLSGSPEDVRARLTEALGTMVLQGLPTVAAKQLARSGIELSRHEHAVQMAPVQQHTAIPIADLVAAAPHLTDQELAQLSARLGNGAFSDAADRQRALRRQALALVNEFRCVPCVVYGESLAGKADTLDAVLNLTNGSVMVQAHDRDRRISTDQGKTCIELAEGEVRMPASCAGSTISGPVIEVAIADLAAHRDILIGLWQRT
ncbi:MAG TPA: hypothetical protein VKY38_01365 [Azoarcus sp.]|nr:hypothetical protein [Azoarcus sp.]